MQISNTLIGYYADAARAYASAGEAVTPSNKEEKEGSDLLNPLDTVHFSQAAVAAAKQGADAGQTAADTDAEGQQGAGASGSEQSEEIQAQISRLSAQLGQIMGSSLPEELKSAQAAPVQAQLASLIARLSSLS